MQNCYKMCLVFKHSISCVPWKCKAMSDKAIRFVVRHYYSLGFLLRLSVCTWHTWNISACHSFKCLWTLKFEAQCHFGRSLLSPAVYRGRLLRWEWLIGSKFKQTVFKTGVSNIRPVGQNWPIRGSNLGHLWLNCAVCGPWTKMSLTSQFKVSVAPPFINVYSFLETKTILPLCLSTVFGVYKLTLQLLLLPEWVCHLGHSQSHGLWMDNVIPGWLKNLLLNYLVFL